jgi:PiT family inorganic phosphate transporter
MDLTIPFATLVVLVALALIFDFMNGFHDAANSIATVVSTGVLRPHQAVVWAAFFNFVAIFIFHLKVAATVGKGIVDPDAIDHYVIFGALVGAIAWNLITWYYGIPSSSSHALIGGMIGATLAKAGTGPLLAPGILKTATFIVVAPFLGMTLGALLMIAVSWACLRRSPRRVDQWFRRLQLISSALYSIGHGSNDAQKTMGIIWLLLITAGMTTRDHLPYWVIVSCYVAIALGTLFGGWRIVKTMGQRITKLRPVGGFAAETGGAMTLFLASSFGIPVSTTHTITGAIVGVGATRRLSAVRWGVAGRIVWAWILTMPAAAIMAAVTYAITVSKLAVAALILAAVFVAVVLAIRRNRRDVETVEPAAATEPTPSGARAPDSGG